jgi:hypothetical protein
MEYYIQIVFFVAFLQLFAGFLLFIYNLKFR